MKTKGTYPKKIIRYDYSLDKQPEEVETVAVYFKNHQELRDFTTMYLSDLDNLEHKDQPVCIFFPVAKGLRRLNQIIQ
jgi:hypothetical protein